MTRPDRPRERGIRPGIRRLFRLELRHGPSGHGGLDEEIRFHLECRADQLVRAGYSPEQAWTEAARRFAGPGRTLTQTRDSLRRAASVQETHMRIRGSLGDGWHAVRQAARALRRQPGFAAIVVATLALGIGATAAMFAVVNNVLLRPLPYGHPGELVAVTHDARAIGASHIGSSMGTYFTYRRYARTIAGTAIYREGSANVADPRGGGEPRRLPTAAISGGLIPLLQVAPRLGRSFTAAEDAPHGAAVVIISEALWRSRYGADSHVLGRTLQVDGVSREIVGVMPERFRFPSARTELWVPLALDPGQPFAGSFDYNGVARRRAGVTLADVRRDLAAALPRMVDVTPNAAPGVPMQTLLDQAKLAPVVTPLQDDVVGDIARTLWIVAATAALVLLVACANVANLVLVRVDGRQRELAVRAALGAGRLRALAPLFAECAVLAAIAGALGLAVAAVGIRALVSFGPVELPRLAEVRVDGTVAAFTLAVTALVALACGAIPALRLGRGSLAITLREGGRSGTAGRARQRTRGALVAAQIALALVVLAASGLLLRSFRRLYDVRPGWSADHVTTLWLSLPAARYPGDSDVVRFYARLTASVAELPAVRTVGITSHVPLLARGQNTSLIWVEGDPSASTKLPPPQLFATVDGGFFGAMRIALLAGRTFQPIDGAQRGDEAIVNRTTATQFWHDSTGRLAIGKRFRSIPNGPWVTVVGVVENVRDTSLQMPPAASVYFPEAPGSDSVFSQVARTMALVVRTSGDPIAVVKPIERMVAALDPSLPVFDVNPMAAVVRTSMARLTFTMLVLGVAAAVTLLLGTIGLYGVIAYVVAMRARELGVRIALGATPRAVARMVTRQGMTLAAAGIAGGLVLFAFAARFVRALLFGITPMDPLTIGVVSLLLVAVAALASWIPARRAARADPMEALRGE